METTTMKNTNKEAGFTLVELAVVMIIIGLLLGGVLKGQELIANAKVNATIAQIKAMDAATNTFRDMYNGFPGDLLGANTRIPNCANSPCFPAANAPGTGRIDELPGEAAVAGQENVSFFTQLNAAGLLGGLDSAGTVAWGSALPAAEIAGGFHVGFSTGTAADFIASTAAGGYRNGHYFAMTADPAGATALGTVSLTANQAARIDFKMDDGSPDRGSVRAYGAAAAAGCVNAAAYQELNQGTLCGLYIRFQE